MRTAFCLAACALYGASAHEGIPLNPVLGEGGYPDCEQTVAPDQLTDDIETNMKTLVCRPPPRKDGVINIGCVGDSITAGAHSSSSAHAYPQQLGQILEAKYPGKYQVTNLGACGSTMLKSADSPYWKRSQFSALVKGTWDIIVIMLGTNDAKDAGDRGPHNWPHNCSTAPGFAAEDCLFTKDYASMIELVRTLGNGSVPDVYVNVPPPLMHPGVYGMNATVINDVFPKLVPFIAKENKVPASNVIDVYSGMGGPANWVPSDFPAKGCTLKTPSAAKCPWFCDKQSCDQCHPNDVGYNQLAKIVQKGLGL